MKYKIADLIVEFEPKFDMLKLRSEKYLNNSNEKRDFGLYVTDDIIQEEVNKYPDFTAELAEYMLIGNTFYKKLLNYKGCLLHASSVVIDDEAYLFSADCGTGKSTHTSLWMKYLADKNPYILNDDKPAIRIFDDVIYAYGTPFSGKNDISENKKVKLKGICFIEQSKTNSIEKINSGEAIKLFMKQTFIFLNEEDMLKLLDILDIIIKEIPIYKLCCDMSEEAVQLSYKTMKGDTNESKKRIYIKRNGWKYNCCTNRKFNKRI